jgi:4-hydroxy-4-methyl-2-oxoglutarate aldolase
MHPRIRAAWSGASVAGPVFTVQLENGDNLAIHLAVTLAPEGSVLVVDASDRPDLGYWGEVLTTAAEARGIAGLVIDGGVRDVAALRAHGFPAFSAVIALPGAAKVAGGAIDLPVRVGDVAVTPGDWVVADTDGVTVVPGASVGAVVAAGWARADKEIAMFEQLRAGATTIELLQLDPSPVRRPSR